MILIVGFGNPLRGDDALGQVAAAHLARLFRDDDAVRVRAVHQLTPELAEAMAGCDVVLLIDARRGGPPGGVVLEEVQPEAAVSHPFSHYVTPAELLVLAGALYGATPRLFLASVTAAAFDVGQPLSPPVRAALPLLLERVAALVHTQRQATAPHRRTGAESLPAASDSPMRRV